MPIDIIKSIYHISIRIQEIPENLRKEVLDYIEYNYKQIKTKAFKFDWEGSLSEEKITSVELQHKALDWR